MKYIVYKTTNLVNNYIYIGVHKTENPDIFDNYIGNGVYINKPHTYEKSKTKFQQAVNEFGTKSFKREVLAIYDTPEEAYSLEEQLVNENFLARSDVYNMVLGGKINNIEGIPVYMYDESGLYIKSFSSYEDAGKYLSVQPSSIRRAVVYKYRVKNNYFTNIKVDKIDIKEFNTNKKIKVYRYLKDNKYDSEFESYNEAARNSDSSPSNIRSAALTGYCVKDLYYFSFIKKDSYDKARTEQIKTREVHKYDSDGNYLCSYNTQQEAEFDNPYSNITKSIKLKSLDENGYLWGLEKLESYNSPKRKGKRKVGLFSETGELIKTWDSARACAREVGTAVQNVLNGKYLKHKGNIYKYIDN